MDSFDLLMKSIISLGPAGIVAGLLLFFWKRTDDERLRERAANQKLMEGTIESRLQLANALDKIAVKIGA